MYQMAPKVMKPTTHLPESHHLNSHTHPSSLPMNYTTPMMLYKSLHSHRKFVVHQ